MMQATMWRSECGFVWLRMGFAFGPMFSVMLNADDNGIEFPGC